MPPEKAHLHHLQYGKRQGRRLYGGNHKWHGGGIAKEQLEEALCCVRKNRRIRNHGYLKTTYDFDQMLVQRPRGYGEELFPHGGEGLDFAFTYSTTWPPLQRRQTAREISERCFNFGIASPPSGRVLRPGACPASWFTRRCSGPSCPCAAPTRFTRTSPTTTSSTPYRHACGRDLRRPHAQLHRRPGPVPRHPNLTIFVPADAASA